jgi:response regulator RpfG family c-di-GMP phosphodiesterase
MPDLNLLIQEFLSWEGQIKDRVISIARIKFKQAQIIRQIYSEYGKDGIDYLSKVSGYHPDYLLAHLKILKKFPDEDSLVRAIEEGMIKRISDVIRGEKILKPTISQVLTKVEKNIQYIEKKVVETEEILQKTLIPEEVPDMKREFENFKNYVKNLLFDKIFDLLFEIYKLPDDAPIVVKAKYTDEMKRLIQSILKDAGFQAPQ